MFEVSVVKLVFAQICRCSISLLAVVSGLEEGASGGRVLGRKDSARHARRPQIRHQKGEFVSELQNSEAQRGELMILFPRLLHHCVSLSLSVCVSG